MLQKVTSDYSGFKGVIGGYKGFMELQGVRGG